MKKMVIITSSIILFIMVGCLIYLLPGVIRIHEELIIDIFFYIILWIMHLGILWFICVAIWGIIQVLSKSYNSLKEYKTFFPDGDQQAQDWANSIEVEIIERRLK